MRFSYTHIRLLWHIVFTHLMNLLPALTCILLSQLPSYFSRYFPILCDGKDCWHSSQLSIFHVLSISKRFSSHRLLPTTLTSSLSLIHFHTALYFYFRKSDPVTPARSATNIQASGSPQQNEPYIAANGRYPLLNYVPNMIETALLLIIFLTVFVNALVQLLIQGRIYRLFDGFRFVNRLPSRNPIFFLFSVH